MTKVEKRIEGVAIGVLMGFDDGGRPLVVFPGNPIEHAVPARSLSALDNAATGTEVALLFEGGDPARPLIVGRIVEPAQARPAPLVVRNGERVRVVAGERIELRSGKASIILKSDGSVTIRGTQILSRAERGNRVQGATVLLN